VRRRLAVLLLVVAIPVFARDVNAPGAMLERGVAAFRAGDAAGAAADLNAALAGFLSEERCRSYVDEGRLEDLPSIETALVYLALAEFRAGREDDARQTLRRLLAVERIAPTYAVLPLGDEAVELETLASALLPLETLPRNGDVPADDASHPLAAIAVKDGALDVAQRQQLIDVLTAGSQRPGALASPAEVAPASGVAVRSVRPDPPAELTRDSGDGASPIDTPPATAARVSPQDALRDATLAAEGGDLGRAVALYSGAIADDDAPRELLAAAATGLYRSAAFGEAVRAFRRLGTFALGEEDLRYYYAVSLYESGDHAQAQKELQCALPFIVETDHVLRYRNKIESTLASK
jgi:tetratricopeptide (TPR) repeat protein